MNCRTSTTPSPASDSNTGSGSAPRSAEAELETTPRPDASQPTPAPTDSTPHWCAVRGKAVVPTLQNMVRVVLEIIEDFDAKGLL